MSLVLLPVVNALSPVLAGAGLGWWWTRSGRPLDTAALTPLMMSVGTPCLVFGALARVHITPEAFAASALAATVALAAVALAGALLLRVLGLDVKTFFASVAFPNAGALGLPVAWYGLGPEGFAHAVVFYALSSIGNFVVGQTVAAQGAGWSALLRMPMLWAALGGAAVSAGGIALPQAVLNAIELIGTMSVPIMLLLLGAALGRLAVGGLARSGLVAAIRFGCGLAVGLGVATAFGLEGPARMALILQSAMPVSLHSYVFAQRFGNAPEEVAGAVMVSSLAGALSIPLVLAGFGG